MVTKDMATQSSLTGESVRIALLYLLLVTLFFASLSFFSPMEEPGTAPAGFVGQSALVNTVSGFVSLAIMSLTVWKFRGWSMVRNLLLCFAVSSVVAVADFVLTREFYRATLSAGSLDFSLSMNIKDLFMCWAMFFGWSCLYLTILYSFDVRDRERRLAATREEALAAQMRALRYQISPHFLFNTLNSIGGLIEEGSAARAERMVLSLSTFLRTTLTLDPLHDVTLAEELALQHGYLEIERERFSDRLHLCVDVPPDLGGALVPSLILQPLIENAIKHGVGTMAGEVRIGLSARRQGERLRIVVENDMPARFTGHAPAGMGVGLRNVRERLRARFQTEATFTAGPGAMGTYRATLDMPWRTD